MRKIIIGLLGYGTVGSSVFGLIKSNKEKYKTLLNIDIYIKKILVSDLKKDRKNIPRKLITDNFKEILEDKSINIVIEAIGGLKIAKKYIEKSLQNKKHVITANKDLIAVCGQDLFKLADKNQCYLKFEASVAAALPIIETIKNELSGNKITKIMGIINGTTNYILTKMFNENLSLEDALKKAQNLGYVELDPSADIEGLDAARKIAILASVGFNTPIYLKDVYVEGINKIDALDIKYAKQFNSTIKLLGIACVLDDKIEVRVHPTLIPMSHPLAKIDDIYNAIYLEGDAFGDLTISGKGAGGYPTASAIVGDLIGIIKKIINPQESITNLTGCMNLSIRSIDNIKSNYYIRMIVEDKVGVLSQISGIFAKNNVSIDFVIQRKIENNLAELVLLTDKVKNINFINSKKNIAKLKILKSIRSILRAEKEI